MAPQDIVKMYEVTITTTTKYDPILVSSEFTKKMSLFSRIFLAPRRGHIPRPIKELPFSRLSHEKEYLRTRPSCLGKTLVALAKRH